MLTHIPDNKIPTFSRDRSSGKLASQKQHPRIQQLLRGKTVQPKLTIGAPNDKYEQEADRVADQVMRMPDPAVQRQTDIEEGQQNSLIQTKPLAQQITPLNTTTTQRLCTECEDELQRKPSNDTIQRDLNPNELDDDLIQAKSNTTPEVTPNISAGIQSLQGGGRPLSNSERNFFEPRFGTDFSNVRLHTDAHAANLAHSINARAFTHGNNIALGAGEYAGNNKSDKELMAHELTHVVQQGNSDEHINRQLNGTIQRQESGMTFTVLEEELANAQNRNETSEQHERRIAVSDFLQNSINRLQFSVSGRYVLPELGEFVIGGEVYRGNPFDPAHPVTGERNLQGETWDERSIRLTNLIRILRELINIVNSQPVPLDWYPEHARRGLSDIPNLQVPDITGLHQVENDATHFLDGYYTYTHTRKNTIWLTVDNGFYMLQSGQNSHPTSRDRGISTGRDLEVADPINNPTNVRLLDQFGGGGYFQREGVTTELMQRGTSYFYYIYEGQEISLPEDPRSPSLPARERDRLMEDILDNLP